MEYQFGFEIKGNIERNKLPNLILQEVEKEEAITIEMRLCPHEINEDSRMNSLSEIISKKIAELESHKQGRECWHIYFKVDNNSDFKRKESYWLELIYEKFGIIARPLTADELELFSLFYG